MRFSGISGLSGFSAWRDRGTGSAWRDHFLCGGLLLIVSGWMAVSPPPRAPTLPSKCQAQLRFQNTVPDTEPSRVPPVWVDTRSGLYYYPTSACYGHTPGGKYLEAKVAKAKGYRSSTKGKNDERNQR
jgi:hypothetical protein